VSRPFSNPDSGEPIRAIEKVETLQTFRNPCTLIVFLHKQSLAIFQASAFISIVESVTEAGFFDFQLTGPLASMITFSVHDFLSSASPVQSESV